jgi:hypothetical protein
MMNREDAAVVEAAFVAGFRAAPDKRSFLTLAGIPLEIERSGQLGLKLIEVKFDERYRVGSAAPGFGTRELSYQPLPGTLVTQSTGLTFVYVSADGVVEKSFAELRDTHGHVHEHTHEHGHEHHHRHTMKPAARS